MRKALVWLWRHPLAIALLVVVIGGAAVLWSFSSESANLRKFDSIRDGMTQAEVESILGDETVEHSIPQPSRLVKFWGASHKPIRARQRYWILSGRLFVVRFDHWPDERGRVSGVELWRPESFLDRLMDWVQGLRDID